MNIEKRVLTDLHRCYAVTHMNIKGKEHFIYATEGEGAAIDYTYPELDKTVIWSAPGGTMSIVPIPGKEAEFLAVQNFFPTFQAENAYIVWSRLEDGAWKTEKILDLPYVHRFDILRGGNGRLYFIGATLCSSKKYKEDWSDPGKIWVCELPNDLRQPMRLTVLTDGLVKNHGFCKLSRSDGDAALIGCESGIYKVIPPDNVDDWRADKIFEGPVSDMAVADIDGCGQEEIALIEGFHGKAFKVYKSIDDGNWHEIYSYPENMDFLHVAWGGMICGKPAFIGGYRREAKQLFLLNFENGKWITTVIDEGVGPSNIAVFHAAQADIILSANRELGQAAMYRLSI